MLADELQRALGYYQDHVEHAHGASPSIASALLTGGDANLRGLDTYLASILKIPVARADIFSAVRGQSAYDIPPFTKTEGLAFATAFGLALRGIRAQ